MGDPDSFVVSGQEFAKKLEVQSENLFNLSIRVEELTQAINKLEETFNGILQLAQGMSATSQPDV